MKKLLLSVITGVTVLCSFGFAACNESEKNDENEQNTPPQEIVDEHVHNWVLDEEKSGTPTCSESAIGYYYCTDCDETKEARIPATGNHDYGDDNVCDVCGFIDMSGLSMAEAIETYGFYFQDKNGDNAYSAGDFVYFGSYPQAQVTDSSVLTELNKETGVLPTADYSAEEDNEWSSYGYYAEGQASDYAFYKDVEVGGTKYRGVYLLGYRPYYSDLDASGDYSYIDDSFSLGQVYWFAYAPVTWQILDYADGNLFLNATYCLEGQPYQAFGTGTQDAYVIPGTDTFVNDWESSTIRAFLNEDFYNLAFTEAEQNLIQTVTLDNRTTGYTQDNVYQINQNDTQDKVFLLSYQDMSNEDYGFASGTLARTYSDYASIQGLRPSTQETTADGDPSCYYILRSAGSKSSIVCGVSKKGTLSYTSPNLQVGGSESYDGYAVNGDLGVIPALYIKIN